MSIRRNEIERAAKSLVSDSPDIDYELVKEDIKHDSYIVESIVMRLNYLKHSYQRAKNNNDDVKAEEILNRICDIMPGFMLARKNDV